MSRSWINLGEYIGPQIIKPGPEHVDEVDYQARLAAATQRFDHLVGGLAITDFNGGDLVGADYIRYDSIDLGDHDTGKQLRGVQGVSPVLASFVFRILNSDPDYRNEQRQIQLWSADRFLGAHFIESGHTYLTSVNNQKLDKFNSLIRGIAALVPVS